MRTITTTAGTAVELDGDVLAVIEAISRDLTRRQGLEYGFEEIDREFQNLVRQMTDPELRVYLKESLFMSFNRYENDRMLSIMKRANRASQSAPNRDAGAASDKAPSKRRAGKPATAKRARGSSGARTKSKARGK